MESEKQLIARVHSDKRVFREVVEQHKQQVYYLALDLAGNHADAQDLSQEAFLKAYKAVDKFRGDSKLGSWLYRITVNCFIDMKRKRQILTTNLEDKHEAEFIGSSKSKHELAKQERGLEGAMLQKNIEKALAQLTPRERSVFVLRHYQEFSLKEIAGVLSIAEGTVKSLLFRALQRLQKELEYYRPDIGLE